MSRIDKHFECDVASKAQFHKAGSSYGEKTNQSGSAL